MALRLGDDLDDYCVKCKRITNHSVVSLVGGEPVKVRCRSCYSDHNYLRSEIPPAKKTNKKSGATKSWGVETPAAEKERH